MDFPSVAGRIPVNVPDRQNLIERVSGCLRAGDGFALATINLDHLVKLKEDKEFAAAYLAQDLVVADGNPIVWLSHVARQPVTLMPGSDLVLPLAKVCADLGAPIGLIGTTDEALATAADRLTQKVPNLKVACRIAPPMGFDPQSATADEILRQAAASGARVCFLALGAPKQENFAARGREIAPELGFVSVGAGLDFLAGTQTRAPVWVRKTAMEWLWRMLLNPGRMAARYMRCFAILPELTSDAYKQRKS